MNPRPKAASGQTTHAPGTAASSSAASAAPTSPALVVMEGPRSNIVAAAKRNAVGEALPKQVRFNTMDVDGLLNPTPPSMGNSPGTPAVAPPRASKPKKSTSRRTPARKVQDTSKVLAEQVGPYDLFHELANASTGLKFGHVLRGDAREAEKHLRRLFRTLRRQAKKVGAVLPNQAKRHTSKTLKLTQVQIYATEVAALLDTGAVPNLISAELVDHLNLAPKATNRTITVADGSNSMCIGRLRNVPITFGHLTIHLDFLTVKNAPVSLLIGVPSMEEMRAVLDFGSQCVDIKKGDDFVRLSFRPDTGMLFEGTTETEGEMFTSESSADESSDSSDESEDEEQLVVALAKEGPSTGEEDPSSDEEADQAASVALKLSHLPDWAGAYISKLLRDCSICAWSFEDLHAAEVPIRHSFELTDDRPVYHNPRRMSPRDNQTVREEIDKMLRAGIIVPADSAWAFPVVIVAKKDGSPRFCIDYRILNGRIKPSRWPIPHIEEIFDDLRGAVIFTTLDLFSGYWQIQMEESHKDITTFTTRFGNFRFEVMPMGLINAPSTFQKMMDGLLKDIPFARAYLDDVVIFSASLEDHLEHLQVVLTLLAGFNLRLRVAKCFFAQPQVELLGHIVDKEGVHTDPKKIKAIKEAPTPTDTSGVRSFLGLAGYYRRFIRNFADHAKPLHEMTSPKVTFRWTPEAQKAFDNLKEALTSSPVLAFPNFEAPFVVETDASAIAVGAVLAQKQGGRLHPIQFASRSLNSAERNYSACEREAVGVIFALRKFRLFLLSEHRFDLVTDHQALRYAFAKKDVHGRLARWMNFLAEYNYRVVYKPGKENCAADFLSRHAHSDPAIDTGDDEGLVMVAVPAQVDLEPALQDIKLHLEGKEMVTEDVRLRRNARRAGRHFLVWNNQLFRRTTLGPKVVVPRQLRQRVLRMFHDSIGHWDVETTRQFIAERFWWPRMPVSISHHVRSCDGCQRAAAVPRYRTTLRAPLTGLFDTFSLDFAGPLIPGPGGERYLLIAVEHLTSWPIAIATVSDTADVVHDFVKEHILHPFGSPRVFVSDNAKCFTAPVMKQLMSDYATRWRTVGEYAPMSNGRAERMVGTIKRAIAKTVLTDQQPWTQALGNILFGYRRRRLGFHPSPYELMYGVPPRMTPFDSQPLAEEPQDAAQREIELLAIQSARAHREHTPRPESQPAEAFKVGEKVLVAKAKALGALKMPPFESKWYGPCIVETAKHPLYHLTSPNGKRSRKAIHARRLKRYIERQANYVDVSAGYWQIPL